MTRVYGRLQDKTTKRPLAGYIMFEPKELGYVVDNILFANFVYYQELERNGSFDLTVAPAEYFVYMDGVKLEVDVPAQNEITLKEMLTARYKS